MIKPLVPELGDPILWHGYTEQWGFWDEVGLEWYGRYHTRERAVVALEEYCCTVLGGAE